MSGKSEPKTVFLDSNIFVYHFEENLQYLKYTKSIFEKLELKKVKAVTSVISLAEILSFPLSKVTIRNIQLALFDLPNLEIKEITIEIALKTAKLRRNYNFKLPDSMQLATAIVSGAKAFITNDRQLRKCKEIKVILLSDLKI